jgi:hypothetical protein
MKNKVGIFLALTAVAAAGLFAASSIVQTAFAAQSFGAITGSTTSGSVAGNLASSGGTGASAGFSAGNSAGTGSGGASGSCSTSVSFTDGGCTTP